MDREFHYNTIFVLAREAGFDAETSLVIAASSQLVDDAVFNIDLELPDRKIGRAHV